MRHEFAFYLQDCEKLFFGVRINDSIYIVDTDLVHRMQTIVRLSAQDACVIFDQNLHVLISISAYQGKKSCTVVVKAITHNTVFVPHITVLLPLLKKEAFEEACYNMVELGAQIIQPVITQKIQRSWAGKKELERLQKIIIAAAEQSKNYNFCHIKEPISLHEATRYQADARIFCDSQGKKLWDVVTSLQISKPKTIALLIGPEGDMTPTEKDELKKANFIFCALTPTILRSYQAISLAVGVLRSLL